MGDQIQMPSAETNHLADIPNPVHTAAITVKLCPETWLRSEDSNAAIKQMFSDCFKYLCLSGTMMVKTPSRVKINMD